MKTINVKRLRSTSIIPKRETIDSAGADLHADIAEPVFIPAGSTVKIPTGIAMAIPSGYAGLVMARSGLSTKQGLAPANKVGLVDADYRGEVMVALHNHSTEGVVVEPDMRIAQLVIIPVEYCEFVEGELNDTVRGSGGFGSTGK